MTILCASVHATVRRAFCTGTHISALRLSPPIAHNRPQSLHHLHFQPKTTFRIPRPSFYEPFPTDTGCREHRLPPLRTHNLARPCFSKEDLPALKPTLQSGAGGWTATVVFTLLVICAYSFAPNLHHEPPPREYRAEALEAWEPGTINKMTGESLPGRPGNLTPQEQEKLKELWTLTLRLSGVLATGQDIPNGEAKTNGNTEHDGSHPDKKVKRKRFASLRSKDKADIDPSPATESPSSEAEDKHGQTKEYLAAIATLSPEQIRTAYWAMLKLDNPDALLLRFLRARKWDVEKALIMMISTLRWRLEVRVDEDTMLHGELGALEASESSDPTKRKLGEEFLSQMRLGKSFLHGVDMEHRPMVFVRARLHKSSDQCEETLERFTIYVIETARLVLSPPVDTACVVFDMTGFGMANMDYAPVKFMIKIFEANYPESLGTVVIYKAPFVFSAIWKVIRGWLDPVVAAKVTFAKNPAELSKYVAESKIIKELDGTADWSYTYRDPVPGENDPMKDTATRDRLLAEREVLAQQYEKATVQWIGTDGTGDEDSVMATRHDLAAKLRKSYWELDPYVRARSHYDRIGMIKQGGVVNFYPETDVEVLPVDVKGKAVAAATNDDDVD